MLAEDGDGRERLERRNVSAAGQDNVGLSRPFVVRGPLPDARCHAVQWTIASSIDEVVQESAASPATTTLT